MDSIDSEVDFVIKKLNELETDSKRLKTVKGAVEKCIKLAGLASTIRKVRNDPIFSSADSEELREDLKNMLHLIQSRAQLVELSIQLKDESGEW